MLPLKFHEMENWCIVNVVHLITIQVTLSLSSSLSPSLVGETEARMFRGATTASVSLFLRGWRYSFEDARVKFILNTLVLGPSVSTGFVSDGIHANICQERRMMDRGGRGKGRIRKEG